MKPNPVANPLTIRFVDDEMQIQGVIEVRITIPTGQHVEVKVHIVAADMPLLIGMEFLCAEGLML